MTKRETGRAACLAAMIMVIAAGTMSYAPAAIAGDHQSRSDVFWWWDQGGTTLGSSKLVRTPNGIMAVFKTSALQPGHAMTLWFIVFNNPAACAGNPCTVEADFENPAVMADFLVAGGNVTGGGRTTVAGHLLVGDKSGSGYNEFGLPEFAVGLVSPMTAEVTLGLHSHGPAQTGAVLSEQISSYLGGCLVFLGPGGFAAGPGDIPVNDGECSTMQASHHQP